MVRLDAPVDVVEPMGMETLIHFFIDGAPVCARVDPRDPCRTRRDAAAGGRHEQDAPDGDRQRPGGLTHRMAEPPTPHDRRRTRCAASSRTSSPPPAATPTKPGASPVTWCPPTSPGMTATASSARRATCSGCRTARSLAGQTISDRRRERRRTRCVDGNCGFGQTIGPQAVDLGIAKAQAARAGGGRRCATPAISAASATGASARPRPGWSRSISSMSTAASWWPRSAAWTGASPPTRSASASRRRPRPAAAAARLRDLAGRRGQGAGRLQRRQAGAARAR